MKLIKICKERQKIMVTQLIGLAEAQRKIYDELKSQPEFQNELIGAYKLHQKELEFLIKYQKTNGTKQNNYKQGEEKTTLLCCEYQKTICPDNIKKYTMKCVFGKKDCRIRKYFKRFDGLDLNMLGVGI